MSPAECKTAFKTLVSNVGTLVQLSSGLWSTNHPLNYEISSWTAAQCCRWKEYSVENVNLIPHQVYMYHHHKVFQSTAIDASHCQNLSGECRIGLKALIWEVNKQVQCKYIAHSVIPGRLKGNVWLSDDGQLVLTNTNNQIGNDCQRLIFVSDQSLAYSPIEFNRTYRQRGSLDEVFEKGRKHDKW